METGWGDCDVRVEQTLRLRAAATAIATRHRSVSRRPTPSIRRSILCGCEPQLRQLPPATVDAACSGVSLANQHPRFADRYPAAASRSYVIYSPIAQTAGHAAASNRRYVGGRRSQSLLPCASAPLCVLCVETLFSLRVRPLSPFRRRSKSDASRSRHRSGAISRRLAPMPPRSPIFSLLPPLSESPAQNLRAKHQPRSARRGFASLRCHLRRRSP